MSFLNIEPIKLYKDQRTNRATTQGPSQSQADAHSTTDMASWDSQHLEDDDDYPSDGNPDDMWNPDEEEEAERREAARAAAILPEDTAGDDDAMGSGSTTTPGLQVGTDQTNPFNPFSGQASQPAAAAMPAPLQSVDASDAAASSVPDREPSTANGGSLLLDLSPPLNYSGTLEDWAEERRAADPEYYGRGNGEDATAPQTVDPLAGIPSEFDEAAYNTMSHDEFQREVFGDGPMSSFDINDSGAPASQAVEPVAGVPTEFDHPAHLALFNDDFRREVYGDGPMHSFTGTNDGGTMAPQPHDGSGGVQPETDTFTYFEQMPDAQWQTNFGVGVPNPFAGIDGGTTAEAADVDMTTGDFGDVELAEGDAEMLEELVPDDAEPRDTASGGDIGGSWQGGAHGFDFNASMTGGTLPSWPGLSLGEHLQGVEFPISFTPPVITGPAFGTPPAPGLRDARHGFTFSPPIRDTSVPVGTTSGLGSASRNPPGDPSTGNPPPAFDHTIVAHGGLEATTHGALTSGEALGMPGDRFVSQDYPAEQPDHFDEDYDVPDAELQEALIAKSKVKAASSDSNTATVSAAPPEAGSAFETPPPAQDPPVTTVPGQIDHASALDTTEAHEGNVPAGETPGQLSAFAEQPSDTATGEIDVTDRLTESGRAPTVPPTTKARPGDYPCRGSFETTLRRSESPATDVPDDASEEGPAYTQPLDLSGLTEAFGSILKVSDKPAVQLTTPSIGGTPAQQPAPEKATSVPGDRGETKKADLRNSDPITKMSQPTKGHEDKPTHKDTPFRRLQRMADELQVKSRLLAAIMLLPCWYRLPKSKIREAADHARGAFALAKELQVPGPLQARCAYYIGFAEVVLGKKDKKGRPVRPSSVASVDSFRAKDTTPLEYFKEACHAFDVYPEGEWAMKWVQYLSEADTSPVGAKKPPSTQDDPSSSSSGDGGDFKRSAGSRMKREAKREPWKELRKTTGEDVVKPRSQGRVRNSSSKTAVNRGVAQSLRADTPSHQTADGSTTTPVSALPGGSIWGLKNRQRRPPPLSPSSGPNPATRRYTRKPSFSFIPRGERPKSELEQMEEGISPYKANFDLSQ